MRALGERTLGKPDILGILEVPEPEISSPDDILVRSKAVRISQADGLRAAGYTRLVETVKLVSLPIPHLRLHLNKHRLPFIIGINYAGIVSAIGSNVTKFQVGDAVYGFNLAGQTAAEYVLIEKKSIHSIALKSDGMSFEDAACLTDVGHTIVQTLRRADRELEGGLKGKTVLVPAGLVSCLLNRTV